ncbi:M50 family metallopeptidase [Streptomyces sp. NPDC051776]|uniref:metalloprotease n=1 Tax=Streptomyces sp. NPDC051776 TaxID=3155414 RepID=UPI00343537DA
MTTAEAQLAEYRPALRKRILISSGMLHGARTVHLIKDADSGRSFEVGVKEYFLISRMDGTRSLEAIGADYAQEYGRRLGDTNWQRILGMLGSRGLLQGTERASVTSMSAGARSRKRRKHARNSFMRGDRRLVTDADATTARLHRATRFLLSPYAMVPMLLMVAGMEVVMLLHLGEFVLGAWGLLRNPVLLAGAGSLMWLSTTLHELAHGVTARHYGGHVTEIGLRWRLPLIMMYCEVGNYLYLRTRGQRIATAVAGAVMNLLFLLPFCAAWLFVPSDEATHDALGGMVFLGSAQALAMLVPLPPLDGYKIAAQLAGATRLAASSRTYLALAVRRDPAAAAYPRRARIAYITYVLGTVLVICALVAAVAALVLFLLTTL